jgi:TPR repeat protein
MKKLSPFPYLALKGCGTLNGQQDLSECEVCWKKSSDLGNSKAAFSLACMYHKGEVLLQEGELAQHAATKEFMGLAAGLGHGGARQALAKVLPS